MKRFCFVGLAAWAACVLAASWATAYPVANPGFEDPITSDGPPFVGSWEGFSGGAGATSANSSAMPRSGAQHLELSITNTNDTFAGAFQDVPNLTPGAAFTFNGWHKTISDPLDLVVEVRIEWRNSGSDSEVGRTPNSTPIPTSDYSLFSVSAPVPANADTARIVYAIQTFAGGPTNNGTVYVDDVTAVPEPASVGLALCGLAGLSTAGRSRRRKGA
jgi:hypothetical protein